MKSLNILIGAGFSYYAGLPLGNDIKAKFDRPLRDQLLKASSSEWQWAEGKDEVTLNNGRLNSDHLEYAYILEEIVKDYKGLRGSFVDYEDFYQYVKDNTEVDGWYKHIIALAKQRFYATEAHIPQDNQYYGHAFRFPETYRPLEIINYLIADLLCIKKSQDEFIESYKPFINYISKYDSVHIFSLNHDRVFENLFRLYGISFCDGFTTTNSNIKYQNKLLKTYQSDFASANIKLIKPHGSIDMYQYNHGTQENNVIRPDGKYTYFKPGGYYEKHHPERIDPVTKKVLQSMNFDIVPKFITGKNKKAFIQSDYMYSGMYNLYGKQMASTDDLLIIGYSFRDEHMDEELKKFTKATGPNIINLNYGDKFPYEAKAVKEINNFNQL